MNERQLQMDIVLEYLCRREDEGGLGYHHASANIVSKDLFIPSVLGSFVKTAEPNVWSRLLHKYNNDETALEEALKNAVKERFLDSTNVAIFLNKCKTISFEDEVVPLFYASGSELNGDEDFRKNIFSVAEESGHSLFSQGEKIYGVRPDVCFFVNGIFLGYMELKSVLMGQNAMEHGRRKIAKDYLSTVKALVEREKLVPAAAADRKSVMAIYEKAIHLVACDCNETYVMRGIANFYDMAHAEFCASIPKTVDELAPAILKVFKPYPVTKLSLSEKERFEEVMRALYSKRMFEKEVLYYNFIENHYEKRNGVLTKISHHGRLISPRPKQKFGCDKILNRIKEMLDHEKEPYYYTNKLRRELRDLQIPESKIEEIILKRQRFCNNKYVYSLLMQYAAGFGKSNIIGWTALQLKDFRYEGAYAYDKIMLVVDRLQLRGQLSTTMRNMNISEAMYIEATDKDTFIKALDSNKRIIVVNIQKFLDLQNAINESGTKLQQMRVAFLIDEIHRSNSGENNKEMINLFARLQESFNVAGENIVKKNLLIGFTATADDETLTRFGEFRSATTVPLWVPFDYYSMQEAIDDGYILDPTKNIIPYNVPVDFEIPEEVKDMEEADIRVVKDRVYGFEPRMKTIAQFVVDRLVNLVYGKIRGEGKAMLAVRSIPLAIKYTHIIRSLMEEKCSEKKYARYKDAPIVIVYSDSQGIEASSTMNGGLSEEKAIEKFKNEKNGLIIVVDKLQTGFDEPKLHTLFLDKEIKDINAIQTISRVNRTCKYKEECHVIDCSWHNVNIDNIKSAFKKYCDMATSTFNPEEEAKAVARWYKSMNASEPYLNWYNRYVREKEDINFMLEMEDGIRQWVKQNFAAEEAAKRFKAENGLREGAQGYIPETNIARDLRKMIGRYAVAIANLRDIYDIDRKYYDEIYISFWSVFCKIYKDATKNNNGQEKYEYEVTESDEVPGITMVDSDGEVDSPGNPEPGPDKPTKAKTPKGKTMEQIYAILAELRDQEEFNAQQAQLWLKEVGKMFEYMKNAPHFSAIIMDDTFSEEDKFKEYEKLERKYKNSKLKGREDINVKHFVDLLENNAEQLFAFFVAQMCSSTTTEPDFDFDTTVDGAGNPTPAIDMNHLMELIRQKGHPNFDKGALKLSIADQFDNLLKTRDLGIRDIEETTDNLFMVLETETNDDLDGVGSAVEHALNMICRADDLTIEDKRSHLETLVVKYETLLKKIYYLMNNGEEVPPREEGDGATLSNAIYAIKSIKNLKYATNPALQEMSTYLDIVRRLRNDESHKTRVMEEQEVNAALKVVILLYLYSVASNITNMEMEGLNAEEIELPGKIDNLFLDLQLASHTIRWMKAVKDINILTLTKHVIEESDGKYSEMKPSDWLKVVRDFVRIKTRNYSINNEDPINYAQAAENGLNL